MPGKRSKGKIDPSRALAPDVADTPAAGHDDLPVPPDFSGTDGWRGGADGVGPGCGRQGCNSADLGHSADRDRTPLDIHYPSKPVAGEPIRHFPPCVPAGGARQWQWLRGTLEPACLVTCRKVAISEPHRFQRWGFILIPAFEVQDTTSVGFADDRTDDGAFGADDVVTSTQVQKTTFSDDRRHTSLGS